MERVRNSQEPTTLSQEPSYDQMGREYRDRQDGTRSYPINIDYGGRLVYENKGLARRREINRLRVANKSPLDMNPKKG